MKKKAVYTLIKDKEIIAQHDNDTLKKLSDTLIPKGGTTMNNRPDLDVLLFWLGLFGFFSIIAVVGHYLFIN